MGRTCVNAQAELNTCKSDLEKARAMNALLHVLSSDLVICVCVPCVTKPKDSCYVMNVALGQYLTPLIPRLFLVQEKGIAGDIYGSSKRKRRHV